MKKSEKNNILIVRFSSIGDVILTSPILRAVRAAYPTARIDVLTTKQVVDIYRYNPNINHIWQYDKLWGEAEKLNLKEQIKNSLDGGKYDLIIDLQNNLRSKLFLKGLFHEKRQLDKNRIFKLALVNFKKKIKEPRHIVDRYFDTVRDLVQPDTDGLEIWLENEKIYKAGKTVNAKLTIGVAPGAQHFTKRWLPESFAEAINIIGGKRSAVFHFFGGKDDVEVSNSIIAKINHPAENFAGRLSLLETARKIDELDVMITNDTGLMHIAAARRIPTVAIFGSTVPELGFGPYKVPHRIVQTDLNCRPCTHIGRSECPKGHFNCMRHISPEMVSSGVEEVGHK